VQFAVAQIMRITVSGANTPLSDAQRAYAEYRVFTSIAAHETRVRAVQVVIRRVSAADGPFLCSIAVDLGSYGHIKTQARAAHPNAAIDRAADRTGWLVGRRTRSDFNLKAAGFSS
jgi:ribosome-associated translation inhibitor RaiA